METHERRPSPIRISTEVFVAQVNTYPVEAQERISALSSSLLEPDVRENVRKTPEELARLASDLRGSGLSDKEVRFVFRYFTLPRPPALNHNRQLSKLP